MGLASPPTTQFAFSTASSGWTRAEAGAKAADDGELAPHAATATKITYIDGRPATITLRRSKLAVASGGVITEHTFDQDVITIGAMEENDISLDDDTVSRAHCRIPVQRDADANAATANTDATSSLTARNRFRQRIAVIRIVYAIRGMRAEIQHVVTFGG